MSMTSVSGIVVLVLYVGLAVVARFFYPSSFGPATHWLSDLGNRNLNPDGAIYYRLGAMLGGIVLALFFVGLSEWYRGRQSKLRIFMMIAQVLGVLTSFAFAMTGYFSEDNIIPHSFWSVANYILFGTAAFFVGFALLYDKGMPKPFSWFCFLLALVDMLSGFFGTTYWLEWLVVLMLLIFVASVSSLTQQHMKQR